MDKWWTKVGIFMSSICPPYVCAQGYQVNHGKRAETNICPNFVLPFCGGLCPKMGKCSGQNVDRSWHSSQNLDLMKTNSSFEDKS